jgi:mRNA-degrading endonuclease YafQ of YafQ-DinJ toxin-antitoxin module
MNFVSYHKKFKKQLKRLPKKIQDKFYYKLKIFAVDPYLSELNNHLLVGEWSEHRSIDITGDIRAIYRESRDSCVFKAIGTHHQLYGK